ncbi:MAG: hypothetical protein KGJ13_12225, partial [Patescibacteria group bacterium]|nr:hypothetical protein [Patescibacteria group bacterium]
MSENAVIPFTFVRLKTLVDGGLRIEVDVPEIYQPRAFEIFKTGADGAFVRLNVGAASGPTGKNGTSSMVEACDDPRPVKKRHVSETTLKAYELCRDKDFQS